jgi:hypothetical protein
MIEISNWPEAIFYSVCVIAGAWTIIKLRPF